MATPLPPIDNVISGQPLTDEATCAVIEKSKNVHFLKKAAQGLTSLVSMVKCRQFSHGFGASLGIATIIWIKEVDDGQTIARIFIPMSLVRLLNE